MLQIFQIEAIMKCLSKLLSTRNYSAQVESVLFELAGLPCTQASKKLQILSGLIKETVENMVCYDQVLKGRYYSNKNEISYNFIIHNKEILARIKCELIIKQNTLDF